MARSSSLVRLPAPGSSRSITYLGISSLLCSRSWDDRKGSGPSGTSGGLCILRGGGLHTSLQETVLVDPRRGRRAGGDVELEEDVGHVAGDCLLADEQVGGDVAVAAAGGEEADDLDLPGRQPAGRLRGGGGGGGDESPQVGGGAQLLEAGPGGGALPVGGVLVPDGAVGLGQQDAGAGRVVRGV